MSSRPKKFHVKREDGKLGCGASQTVDYVTGTHIEYQTTEKPDEVTCATCKAYLAKLHKAKVMTSSEKPPCSNP